MSTVFAQESALCSLTLIIPAYNEENAIKDVVVRAKQILTLYLPESEILVVSDCSTDRTAQYAEDAGATVIMNPINLGYGNSLKVGILKARYPNIAICDADGSYRPEDLAILLPFMGNFDMVVGQRLGNHFSGSGFKKIGRKFQLWLVQFTTGTSIPDVNSGMRVFHRDLAISFFDTLCGGFSFTTSITIAHLMRGCTVKFLPIQYENRIGKSHVNYYRDTLRSLQIITHAILKYNPIKVFIPLAFIPSGAAFLFLVGAVVALCLGSHGLCYSLLLISAMSLMTAILVFAMGLVATTVFLKDGAEQIRRKSE